MTSTQISRCQLQNFHFHCLKMSQQSSNKYPQFSRPNVKPQNIAQMQIFFNKQTHPTSCQIIKNKENISYQMMRALVMLHLTVVMIV